MANSDCDISPASSSRVRLEALLLIFASVLSGTVLIPAVRPYFAAVLPGHENAMHAFMGVNMLGAALGAPFLAWLADRSGARKTLAVCLAAIDAGLLFALALGPPLVVLLPIRALQGAANVGALSLILGSVRATAGGNMGHGRAFGAAAATMICAVAAGGPLGTLFLTFGPRAPLIAAGSLELLIALLMLRLPLDSVPTARAGFRALLQSSPLLKFPTLWVSVERFAVGTFVVSFSLYAHTALGLSDRHIGLLMSCFLVPFALASYPLGRAADRLNRGSLLVLGMAAYGIAFLLLAVSGAAGLPAVLGLCGVASAAIYSPSLCLAAALVPPSRRSTAMALINAGGSLGMMLGTAVAGIVSAALKRAGWGGDAYRAVFVMTGAVQIITLLLTYRGARAVTREDRTRSSSPIGSPTPAMAPFQPSFSSSSSGSAMAKPIEMYSRNEERYASPHHRRD